MLDHLAIGVREIAASERFYEAALAPLDFAVACGAVVLHPDGDDTEAACQRPR